MLRSNCVICGNNNLMDNFKLKSCLKMTSSEPYNPNETFELNFVGCLDCGCVQLQNLFDPKKIYEEPLQCFHGNALSRHHELFAEFIYKNINNDYDLFEIGGAYGILAKLIINKYIESGRTVNYKIMEFDIDHYPSIENIEYISGNCETYDFGNIKTIIMSHVFEHLYEPKKFIKNIKEAGVENIFISIPDMENLMKNGDINNLNILHTFYIDTRFIVYLFNLYGYKLKTSYNYDNNSEFYYFTNTEHKTIDNCEYKNVKLLTILDEFYKKSMKNIENITINEKFYICPSGFYGRYIYYYLNSETKNNVIGFLDGDKFKINKRLYGTPVNIFEKQHIKHRDDVSILICSKKHENELKSELEIYNKNIKFSYL